MIAFEGVPRGQTSVLRMILFSVVFTEMMIELVVPSFHKSFATLYDTCLCDHLFGWKWLEYYSAPFVSIFGCVWGGVSKSPE